MSSDGRNSGQQQPQFVQVAAALICHDGRYLVTKRRPDAHLGGLWEFPGGKRESGESLEDCLRRELREELGIDVTGPEPVQVIGHVYPDREVELHFFRCEIAGGEPTALGCEAIRWAHPHELAHMDFPPADRGLIDALTERTIRR